MYLKDDRIKAEVTLDEHGVATVTFDALIVYTRRVFVSIFEFCFFTTTFIPKQNYF